MYTEFLLQNENEEECLKCCDETANYFGYKRKKQGYYQYIICPAIDKNLIGDERLMKTPDRD